MNVDVSIYQIQRTNIGSPIRGAVAMDFGEH